MKSGVLDRLLSGMRRASAAARGTVRWLAGDPAYDAYLSHWQVHHAGHGGRPLSRKAFFRQRTQRKWNGINRCC